MATFISYIRRIDKNLISLLRDNDRAAEESSIDAHEVDPFLLSVGLRRLVTNNKGDALLLATHTFNDMSIALFRIDSHDTATSARSDDYIISPRRLLSLIESMNFGLVKVFRERDKPLPVAHMT